MTVRVGAVIANGGGPWDAGFDVAGAARYAELVGLDSLWAGDHLSIGEAAILDGTLVIAAAAAATTRIDLGLSVFIPALRSLGWAGKQVGTLSLMCGHRRLQLGVGTGSAPAEEYAAAGVNATGRGHRTDLFLKKLPDLLSGRAVVAGDGLGTSFGLYPTTPLPRVWVGGRSSAALRRTIRFDAGWMAGLLTAEEFRRDAERLEVWASELGRPRPRLAVIAHVLIDVDRPGIRDQAAAVLGATYGLTRERAHQLAIAGSPAQVAERLGEYVDVGAQDLLLVGDVSPWARSCDAAAVVRQNLRC